MPKQSYEKVQHEVAKSKQMPLITIGYDGRYMKKPQGAFFRYGPCDEATFKELQDVIIRLAKRPLTADLNPTGRIETMASYAQIIKGLEIFAAIEGEDKHNIDAEHDVIYAGNALNPSDRPVAAEELEKLGWKWDDSVHSWRHFT